MNYIQIDIGGKLRGWKANQMTLELWSKKTSAESSNSTSTYAAVYAGLMANCYVKSEEPDFTFEDVCDWTDKLGVTELEKIKTAFEESESYIATLERMNAVLKTTNKEAGNKKKVRMK